MANYGTIPTPGPTPSPYPSHSSFLTHRPPWRTFLNPHTLALPTSYADAITRIRQNTTHFRYNYSLITLIILFLSLISHPVSMIVFLCVFSLWLFFYFSRDSPLVVLGRHIDDRVVVFVLFVVTVVSVVLTSVGVNVLIALSVAVVIVGLHASLRVSDDLFVGDGDDEEGLNGSGLVDVVEGQPLRPTRAV